MQLLFSAIIKHAFVKSQINFNKLCDTLCTKNGSLSWTCLTTVFGKPEMFQSLIDGYLATRIKACSSECSQCLKYVSWLLKYIDIDG